MYDDGLVRFAPVKYSNNSEDRDKFMHLTNYSLNKNCEHYTKNDDANTCNGHKWYAFLPLKNTMVPGFWEILHIWHIFYFYESPNTILIGL